MDAATALVLIRFHTLDGRAVYVNPQMVVSVIEQRGDRLDSDALCVLNMDDGKFLSVRESCDVARKALEQGRTEQTK